MQEQRKIMRSKKQRISLWHRDLHQRRMRKKCGTGQAGNLTDTRSIRFQTKARKSCRTQRFRWQTQRHPSVILRLAFPAAPTENVSLHRSGLRYTTKQKVIVPSADNLSHIPISPWITSSRLQKVATMICQTFNVPAASVTVSSRTYFRKT